MGGYRHSTENARTLMNLIMSLTGNNNDKYVTDNPYTECAYYPQDKKLVVINNSDKMQTTTVNTDFGESRVVLEPYDIAVISL